MSIKIKKRFLILIDKKNYFTNKKMISNTKATSLKIFETVLTIFFVIIDKPHYFVLNY